MNTNQAAIYLGVREADLRRHRDAGTGPRFSTDASGRYNYTPEDLDAFRPLAGAGATTRKWCTPTVNDTAKGHYPVWWPVVDAADWQQTVQEALGAAYVPDLGMVADKSLDRFLRLPCGVMGHSGWRSIAVGAVHWCFDLRGDAPAWVRANVDAIRSMQDANK